MANRNVGFCLVEGEEGAEKLADAIKPLIAKNLKWIHRHRLTPEQILECIIYCFDRKEYLAPIALLIALESFEQLVDHEERQLGDLVDEILRDGAKDKEADA